jgi:hypothetical protein
MRSHMKILDSYFLDFIFKLSVVFSFHGVFVSFFFSNCGSVSPLQTSLLNLVAGSTWQPSITFFQLHSITITEDYLVQKVGDKEHCDQNFFFNFNSSFIGFFLHFTLLFYLINGILGVFTTPFNRWIPNVLIRALAGLWGNIVEDLLLYTMGVLFRHNYTLLLY